MIYTGYVSASAKDWDDLNGSSNVNLSFRRTNDGGGAPTVDLRATALLNTSAITSGGPIVITAATFYWRHASADAAKPMTLSIWNSGTSQYDVMYAGNGGASGATMSTTQTASTILNSINSSGGIETNIYFTCTLNSASLTRTLTVTSYDNALTYTAAPRVEISYNLAASARRRIFIIS